MSTYTKDVEAYKKDVNAYKKDVEAYKKDVMVKDHHWGNFWFKISYL